MIDGESFIHIFYREMYHSVTIMTPEMKLPVEIRRFLDFPIHPNAFRPLKIWWAYRKLVSTDDNIQYTRVICIY